MTRKTITAAVASGITTAADFARWLKANR